MDYLWRFRLDKNEKKEDALQEVQGIFFVQNGV